MGLAGCTGEGGGDEPASDEHLSRSEAAAYAEEWVERNLSDLDEEAFDHYQTGTDAITDENYSRAIREFELASELYEDLERAAFDKRNEFDEQQHRYELFHLAWDMYRLMYESAASWYNSAYVFQVEDNPHESVQMADRAEAHYEEASRVSGEWQNTIDAWSNGGDS